MPRSRQQLVIESVEISDNLKDYRTYFVPRRVAYQSRLKYFFFFFLKYFKTPKGVCLTSVVYLSLPRLLGFKCQEVAD